jgi:molybdopterin converting factor small subunit
MSVVRVPPVLREEAGGAREVEASGATLRELLEDLTARVPALGEKIYDGSEIRPYVNVYVDGEDVRTRGGLDAPVREGATVVLLPAMAGGDGCGDSLGNLGACGDVSDQAAQLERAQGVVVTTRKLDPAEPRRV